MGSVRVGRLFYCHTGLLQQDVQILWENRGLLLLLYYLPPHHTLFLHLLSSLLILGIVLITQSTRLQHYMTICEKDDCDAGQGMDVKSILICLQCRHRSEIYGNISMQPQAGVASSLVEEMESLGWLMRSRQCSQPRPLLLVGPPFPTRPPLTLRLLRPVFSGSISSHSSTEARKSLFCGLRLVRVAAFGLTNFSPAGKMMPDKVTRDHCRSMMLEDWKEMELLCGLIPRS